MRLNLIQKTRKNVIKTRFDYVNGFPDHEIEGHDLVEALSSNDIGGELICDADDDGKYKDRKGNGMETTIVVWIASITTFSRVRSSCFRYENEDYMEYSYRDVCFVMQACFLDERKKTVERGGKAGFGEGSLPKKDVSSTMEDRLASLKLST